MINSGVEITCKQTNEEVVTSLPLTGIVWIDHIQFMDLPVSDRLLMRLEDLLIQI